MKTIISLLVFLSMTLNLSFAHHENAISSYGKSSYYGIVEDLIKGEIKKGMKLTNTEKAVITKFRDGKRQSSSKIKHLISALGKHKCISISKSASLKAWPVKSSVGKFYEFECNSNGAKKLGQAKKDNSKMTKPGAVVTKPGSVVTKPFTKPGKSKVKDEKLTKGKKNTKSKNPQKLGPKTK